MRTRYSTELLRVWRVDPRHVPHLAWLADDDKRHLFRLAMTFFKSRDWETPHREAPLLREKLAVSLSAALPILNLGLGVLEGVRCVVLHPSHLEEDLVGSYRHFAGEIHIAMDAFERETEDGDGNVVVHEIAHAIDHAGRVSNGITAHHPLAGQLGATLAARHLVHRAAHAGEAALPELITDRISEFFARASESFFATPLKLERHEPALYTRLVELYGLDPADELTAARARRNAPAEVEPTSTGILEAFMEESSRSMGSVGPSRSGAPIGVPGPPDG